jgi:transcriptional regulator with XRE-family HTH domain
MTADETLILVENTSLSYIYKVRSEYKATTNYQPKYSYSMKSKISDLHKNKIEIQEIAEKLGCSIQYVYKIIRDNKEVRTNPKMLLMDKICNENDEYYTPLYAVMPISEHLKPNSIIWCPFDTEESYYVKHFRQQGHTVIATHIKSGQDFFTTNPPVDCDYIISNPPYSCKEMVFERLFKLNIPFAMLINLSGIFDAKTRFLMFKDNIEMMFFQTRVQYLNSYNDKKTLKNPPFSSGYICYQVLNEKLIFSEIDRKLICL